MPYQKKPRIFPIIIFMLLALVAASACAQTTPAAFPTLMQTVQVTATPPFQGILQPPEEKFFFIEIWVKIEGTGNVPSARIDKPSYYYDNTSGVLYTYYSKQYIPLGPTDWGLIGQGESLHGAAGGGAASALASVQEFPYELDILISTGKMNERSTAGLIPVPVIFRAVSADGMLVFEIEKRMITLAPNETWSYSVETPILSDKYNGNIRVTSSITNFGWLDINTIHP